MEHRILENSPSLFPFFFFASCITVPSLVFALQDQNILSGFCCDLVGDFTTPSLEVSSRTFFVLPAMVHICLRRRAPSGVVSAALPFLWFLVFLLFFFPARLFSTEVGRGRNVPSGLDPFASSDTALRLLPFSFQLSFIRLAVEETRFGISYGFFFDFPPGRMYFFPPFPPFFVWKLL